jgi:hypothetical protein
VMLINFAISTALAIIFGIFFACLYYFSHHH